MSGSRGGDTGPGAEPNLSGARPRGTALPERKAELMQVDNCAFVSGKIISGE
jgi:hypothetical protein